MSQRGKTGNPNYSSITVQIPKDKKRALKARLAWTDLDMSQAIEALVTLWIEDKVMLETVTQNFSERDTPTELADIRAALGLKQDEIAQRLGMTRVQYGRYERNQVQDAALVEDVLRRARALLTDT